MAPTATAAMTLAIALDESLTKTLVPNVVRDRLRANRVFSSLSVRLVRTVEIVSIAKLAGFEALLFDLEHSSLSLETTAQLSQAALLAGICPLVRVPYNSSEWISRVLDAGAQGVVVPHVSTLSPLLSCSGLLTGPIADQDGTGRQERRQLVALLPAGLPLRYRRSATLWLSECASGGSE